MPEAITTRYALTVDITAPKGAARISPPMNEPPGKPRQSSSASRGITSSLLVSVGRIERAEMQITKSGR